MAGRNKEIDGEINTPKRSPASKRYSTAKTFVHFQSVLTGSEMLKQVSSLCWPYYLYALCDQDGFAFYIGKGNGLRALCHVKEANAGGQSEKCKVIRKLGDRLRYVLIMACADEPFAYGMEGLLINPNYDALTNEIPVGASRIIGMLTPPDPVRTMISDAQTACAVVFSTWLRAASDQINLVNDRVPQLMPELMSRLRAEHSKYLEMMDKARALGGYHG